MRDRSLDYITDNAWDSIIGVLSVTVLVMMVSMMHAAGTGENRPVSVFAMAILRYTAYIWAALIAAGIVSTFLIGLIGIYAFVFALMMLIPIYFWRNAGKV